MRRRSHRLRALAALLLDLWTLAWTTHEGLEAHKDAVLRRLPL